MKLRYIFTALAAAALAFVGCQEEERFLDEVQVSKSIISLPIEGGKDTLTVTATAEWTMELPKDAWFTVDLASGAAGVTQVVFEAEASSANREANLSIACAGAKQTVKVIQMAERVPAALATCKQVLDDHAAGVAVGKNYKIKGTVTDITNYGKYGCFYVNDGTGQVYVYGSMNSAQFDPAVGDIITFEGPWTSYGNFDDVTILELEKSLLSVVKVSPEGPVSLDGGKLSVTLSIKAKEFEVVIPEEAKEWLTYNEKDVITIGETTYIYDFVLAANEGGARNTTVTFKAVVDGVEYSAAFDVEQAGAIKAVTVAEFLAAAEGTSLYELTGVVKNIKNITYGNFDIVDATGSVYVYGLTNNGAVGSNDKTFASLGINEGDKVTIVGTRASYNGTAQVGGTAYLVAHTAAQAATIAEFLAAPVSADKWYKLTGTIESIVKEEYGNFYLTDGTSRVYVYGVTAAPVAKNDKSFPSLGVKAGDKITIVGTRAQYASSSVEDQKEQVGGPAYYVSHEAATEPEQPAVPTIASIIALGKDATVPADTFVEGVVISNMDLSNLTSKKGMYIQDETAGLQFYLAADHSFKFGDKVKVDLSGAKVGAYNGAVQISGLALDKIEVLSSGNTVEPKTVTISDFLANKYEGQYVAIEGVQVADADLSKTFVMGGAHTSIKVENADGKNFVVFSSKYATYGTTTVPQGSGTIKGISSINNGTMQIIFAQQSDFAGLTGTRFGQGTTEPEPEPEPETPAATNRADFETFPERYGQYTKEFTSAAGWHTVNCAIQEGGASDANPVFICIGKVPGTDQWARAVCINGKVGASGVLTSPVIAGGCGTLSFTMANVFTDKNGISFQIEVIQNSEVVKTLTVTKTASEVTQKVPIEHSVDVNVSGSFSLKFTNLSPSNSSTSNKDRVSLWNMTWTSFE